MFGIFEDIFKNCAKFCDFPQYLLILATSANPARTSSTDQTRSQVENSSAVPPNFFVPGKICFKLMIK